MSLLTKTVWLDNLSGCEVAWGGVGMRLAVSVLLISLFSAVMPALAQERVDLELVLLADASRSIDDGEILFQHQGYADSITHPDVLTAISYGFEQRIAVTYVEWGDESSQDVVVPWMIVDGLSSARAFAENLLAAPRRASGPNAIGSALAVGRALIEGNEIRGTRMVIDFSADSAYSGGGVPVFEARAAAIAAGITINGLAILCRYCETGRPIGYDLETAFLDYIIGGPGSFVVTADNRGSFAEAVRRKLLLEVAGVRGLKPPLYLARRHRAAEDSLAP
jgi:hypothetical protein